MTRQLSINLPADIAEALNERVASGAYTNESEVVQESLRALFARDEGIEKWLHSEVVEMYDELQDNPSVAMSSEDMRAHLAKLHKGRATKSTS